MKANEQYFSVMLFIMLYKVVLTFVDGIKSQSVTIQMSSTILHGAVYYAVQGDSNFSV